MTYQQAPVRRGSQVMKVLVVITIAIVAYWAAGGGLDQIQVAEPASTNAVVESQ